MKISAIILAAGLSSRMGEGSCTPAISGGSAGHAGYGNPASSGSPGAFDSPGRPGGSVVNKLLLPYRGRPILEHVLELVRLFGFHRNILVTTRETALGARIPEGFQVVYNPAPEKGQAGSLLLGTEAADGDGYIYFAADQPRLDAATVEKILALAGPDNIVIPVFEGRPGNPVFFAAKFRCELLSARGDKGGRDVCKNNAASCVRVLVDREEILADVDTPEDYLKLVRGDL